MSVFLQFINKSGRESVINYLVSMVENVMICKEEVEISSDFLGVLNLIWIFLKRRETGLGIPGGDSNKRNAQKHKTACLWHS